mmetsp:Transcript_29437/g.63372  ORF Transcript_29437/g.63372 Transcript_29437/m.63372 type:complete len:96 (-) Transcript_29437:95-382(-)
MDPHQRHHLMKNTMIHHHRHHHDHCEDKKDHRRAEAFLSNWIHQNSFHTDCSSHKLNKKGRIDKIDDDNDDEYSKILGESLKSSVSSISPMMFDY